MILRIRRFWGRGRGRRGVKTGDSHSRKSAILVVRTKAFLSCGNYFRVNSSKKKFYCIDHQHTTHMAALSRGCKPWIRRHTQYNFSQPAGDEFAPKWRSLLTSKPSYELDRTRKEAPHLKFSNQKVQDKKLLPQTHTFLDKKNHKTSWKLLRFIGCAKNVNLIITHVELKMHVTISFRRLTVGTSHYKKRFF